MVGGEVGFTSRSFTVLMLMDSQAETDCERQQSYKGLRGGKVMSS